jgi:archaellum component FlaC
MYERLLAGSDCRKRLEDLENEQDILAKKMGGGVEAHLTDVTGKLTTLDTNYKVLCAHYENSMKEISEAIRKINGHQKMVVSFGGLN